MGDFEIFKLERVGKQAFETLRKELRQKQIGSQA